MIEIAVADREVTVRSIEKETIGGGAMMTVHGEITTAPQVTDQGLTWIIGAGGVGQEAGREEGQGHPGGGQGHLEEGQMIGH